MKAGSVPPEGALPVARCTHVSRARSAFTPPFLSVDKVSRAEIHLKRARGAKRKTKINNRKFKRVKILYKELKRQLY